MYVVVISKDLYFSVALISLLIVLTLDMDLLKCLFTLDIEKLNMHEKFLILTIVICTTHFLKLTQIFSLFEYSSNITDNITVQCSLCAKGLHGQQPCQHLLLIIRAICLVC